MNVRRNNRADIREESITFPTTAREKKEIQRAARDLGITMSAFVRIAIREYIKKGEAD